MFYCYECGYIFLKPEKVFETHGFSSPPFEKVYMCPNCKSSSFYEKSEH